MSEPDDQRPRQDSKVPVRRRVDVTLIDEMLRMTPAERLRQNDRMAALVVMVRSAFELGEWEWKSRES